MDELAFTDPLYKVADEIYDIFLGRAERATPRTITDSEEREIWQTGYIDSLLKQLFRAKKSRNLIPHRLFDQIPTDTTDRKRLLDQMQAWNHEHELEEQPVYILNPYYNKG